MERDLRVRGKFYGWFVVGFGALVLAMGGVPLFNGLPVWTPVLRNTFGWTAGQMSWAYSLTQFEGGLLGPLIGAMVDRLGTRRMVLIGFTVLGLGFALFSQIGELWQLYVVFLIMAMGVSMGTWLPIMAAVNNWFIRRRGIAMGLAMEGYAVGGVALPLLLAWAIGGTDPSVSENFGWRNSALFIGVLCLVSGAPLSLLVRNRPADIGQLPDGGPPSRAAQSPVESGEAASERKEEGYTWQQAIRTKTFWFITFGHAFSATIVVTIAAHLGLMLDDRGFSLGTISVVLAVYTAVAAVSMPVGGYLGDRLPARMVAFWFSALQSVALVVAVLGQSTELMLVFAVLYGIGFGGRTSMMMALRGIYFGRKAFAAITGISIAPMNLLLFGAPVFSGLMRDAMGSYDLAFLSIAALSFAGSCLFLFLGRPPGEAAPAAAANTQAAY